MPERQCSSCTRQELWGCTAKQYPAFDSDGQPILDDKGEQKLTWVNPARLPMAFDDEDQWYACPRQDIKENPDYWSALFRFYMFYRKGFLPGEGGLSRQSARALEIFSLVDGVNEECSAQVNERNRAIAAQMAQIPPKPPVR